MNNLVTMMSALLLASTPIATLSTHAPQHETTPQESSTSLETKNSDELSNQKIPAQPIHYSFSWVDNPQIDVNLNDFSYNHKFTWKFHISTSGGNNFDATKLAVEIVPSDNKQVPEGFNFVVNPIDENGNGEFSLTVDERFQPTGYVNFNYLTRVKYAGNVIANAYQSFMIQGKPNGIEKPDEGNTSENNRPETPQKLGKLKIKYADTQGNLIGDKSVEIIDKVETEIVVTKHIKEFPDYVFRRIEGDSTVTLNESTQEVTLVYAHTIPAIDIIENGTIVGEDSKEPDNPEKPETNQPEGEDKPEESKPETDLPEIEEPEIEEPEIELPEISVPETPESSDNTDIPEIDHNKVDENNSNTELESTENSTNEESSETAEVVKSAIDEITEEEASTTGEKLPQTNEKSSLVPMILGLILIVISAISLISLKLLHKSTKNK